MRVQKHEGGKAGRKNSFYSSRLPAFMFSGIFVALLLSTPVVAEAQNNRGKAAPSARAEKREKARKAKREKARKGKRGEIAADAPAAPPPNAPKAEQSLPAGAAQPDPKPTAESQTGKDAPRPSPPASELDDADVRKEGDTEVKMMEFSGLDIEGQLKTPQMLYFLNRLRAEFGRPRLPHRSFMPELQAGTQDKAMR